MPSKTIHQISFPGSKGARLAGRLDVPVLAPDAYALFAHCFTCSKDVHAATRISRALAEEGFATLRFDFTGLGHSEGEFASTDFSSNVDDLVAAADWLRANHGPPSVLIGHSLGGAAVLAAAHRIPEARAVATIGAPSDVGHVEHLFGDARREIESEGEAAVVLGGREFRIRREFLEDVREQRLRDRIAALDRPLMVFHATHDEVVDLSHATRIFTAAKAPRSFVSLDDADHLLTNPRDAAYVAGIIAPWARRYLPQPPATAPRETPGVTVGETAFGRFSQVIRTGDHTLLADEPRSVGGDDTGPGPYELLMAALGACTSMTLRMYAERKELDLDPVRVHLEHDRIHAKDCADCETSTGLVDRIKRKIEIAGDLTPEQRQRLLEIADRCPVHRTLESEVRIETDLA